MKCARSLGMGALLFFLLATDRFAQSQSGTSLSLVSLRDHVGAAEKLDLDVVFIGFPAELQDDLSNVVGNALHQVNIVDPWWIPNIPKYGAPDFALAPAPGFLPPELVPPDGVLRYQPNSLVKQIDPVRDPRGPVEMR
jgi:hypothetical protein